MRLFVALSLPDTVRDRLEALQTGGIPGARWVPWENLHITLRFVGEVDGAQARDLDECLSRIDAPAFDLELVGLDTFGEGPKLRSLHAGVAPEPALTHLQSKVATAIARAGLAKDRQKFRPHVTLARFKGDPGPKLHQFVADKSPLRVGPFAVDRFVLYSSTLGSEGPHYVEEVEYPLERVGAV
jgi:2'-5' RNA ligase